MDIVKAKQETIASLKSLGIDFYEMPNGNFRIVFLKINQDSEYKISWLNEESFNEDQLRKLEKFGFKNEIEKIEVNFNITNQENILSLLTISLEDFNSLMLYESLNGNKKALEILLSLALLGLNSLAESSDFELKSTKDYTRQWLNLEYEKANQLVMEEMKVETLEEIETEDELLSLAVSLTC
jgi:hypothetical protein